MDIEAKIAAAAKEVADAWCREIGARDHLESIVMKTIRKHLTNPPKEEMPKCVDCGALTVVDTVEDHEDLYAVFCDSTSLEDGTTMHTTGCSYSTSAEAIAAYRKLTGSRLVLPMELLGDTDIDQLYPVKSSGSDTIFAFATRRHWADEIAEQIPGDDGRRVLSPIPVDIRVEARQ